MHSSLNPFATRRRAAGFTLVELMIAVAVVAILTSIALPSYALYVKKSGRGETESALMDGKGPVAAIRCIPIRIRRLFVHAYQAYIFNKCLSNAVLDGEGLSTAKPGDLCFESPGPLIFGKIKKFNPDIDSVSKTVPAVRLVGYTFQPGKGRLDVITTNIMQQESVTPRDFYIKEMDELSSPGGFRQSKLGCSGFMHQGSLSLFFKLPKGSYATTLLRELMKPDDPIKSGF